MTFEDLKGLRAEGYIRDSTLDQRDGFGPEIQRKNILRFAEKYGLELGKQWSTEFITSFRRWDKRRSCSNSWMTPNWTFTTSYLLTTLPVLAAIRLSVSATKRSLPVWVR
jgi:hypothetical protein